jgi:hypothetical protein
LFLFLFFLQTNRHVESLSLLLLSWLPKIHVSLYRYSYNNNHNNSMQRFFVRIPPACYTMISYIYIEFGYTFVLAHYYLRFFFCFCWLVGNEI